MSKFVNLAKPVFGRKDGRRRKHSKTNDLATNITLAFNQNKIGLENPWGQCNYLPDRRMKELITKTAIKGALPGATSDLVDYIHRDASKTFAIVLMIFDEHVQQLEAMEAFCFHGFKDSEHLPVPDIITEGGCKYFCEKTDRGKCNIKCSTSPHQICNTRHDRVYDCLHHSCWSKNFWSFRRHQRSFVVQKFNTRTFQHEIRDDRVLPFLPREGMKPTAGGFGIVYPAMMLTDYLIDPAELIEVVNLTNTFSMRLIH